MLDARRLELAMTAARAGNVGAMRQVNRLLEVFDRIKAERDYAGKKDQAPEPTKERVGKKVLDEKLALDADAALMAELDQETRQNVRHWLIEAYSGGTPLVLTIPDALPSTPVDLALVRAAGELRVYRNGALLATSPVGA